jgi:hypothetical protein
MAVSTFLVDAGRSGYASARAYDTHVFPSAKRCSSRLTHGSSLFVQAC